MADAINATEKGLVNDRTERFAGSDFDAQSVRLDADAGEQFSSDYVEFAANVYKRFCPWCGSPVGYKGRGRPRVYCSDRCRWSANKKRDRERRRAVREMMKAFLQNEIKE